ncbi:MAG: hypothetical protein HC897_02485, partial [Thermoanaerobaculia bacterium]|nr:hypothetical protein [Thermoanaerobaculia bacterium]
QAQRRLERLQEAQGRGGGSDADRRYRPDLAARLKQLNLIKIEQVANLSGEDIANVEDALNLNGRIQKDDWIGKARALLGGLLGIKPILGLVDGEITAIDRARAAEPPMPVWSSWSPSVSTQKNRPSSG